MTSSRTLIRMAEVPSHEAVRLLAAAAASTRAAVLTGFEVDAETRCRYDALVEARRSGRPLQHLEGSVSFGPLELSIDRRALIPRPETEYLWSLLSVRVVGPRLIVDVGTGSGALALALQTSFPAAVVVATEVSEDAAALARHNAARTGLAIEVREGDLLGALSAAHADSIDLMVSNPPYVAEAEWAALPSDVRDHDPRLALVAGEAGTEIIARLVDEAIRWLRPGGLLAVEIGERQGAEVLGMAEEYVAACIEQDLAGRDRYLFAERPIE